MTDIRFFLDTDKAIDDVTKAVTAALAARRFSVLWSLDITETLAQRGHPIRDHFVVLEVCSAPLAQEALLANPAVSYFMPCKIVISRHGETTRIGMPRPTALVALVDQDGPACRMAAEAEVAMMEAISEAVR